MSGQRSTMETIRRVYDDDNGAYIEVGPDADGLGCVEIRTTGEANEAYCGKVRLTLSPVFAAQLAEAIRLCAKDQEQ